MMTTTLQEHTANLLASLEPDAAVTLRYNAVTVSRERIDADLKTLHARADQILIGSRRYHKNPNRSKFWAVIEMREFSPHLHIGWKLPQGCSIDDLKSAFDTGLWKKIFPSGSHDVRAYIDKGWCSYCTKSLIDLKDVIWTYF